MGKYKNSAISSFVNKNGTPKEQLERAWFELTGRRFSPDLVWTDMESGALPADQRQTVAAGATVRNGCHSTSHHQGYD